VFLSQGLQHFLIALAAADLLPAPPIKSGFVAVDSGHVYLLHGGLMTVKRRAAMFLTRPSVEVASMVAIPLPANHRIGPTAWPFLETDALGLKDLTFAGSQIRHVIRLSGNFSIAKAQRAVRVSSRSRP
jgi:hypothetical protein